jgi:hypothetical protein
VRQADASQTFEVNVGNASPVVTAGPDTTADWGRPVAFNGQATDPGSADQSTLTYKWTFGDGTPSATGGPSVLHSYATPNTSPGYTATLEVCDKDLACVTSTRTVLVTKRDTSLGYLGDITGTYDTPASLSASLVDEYGASVNGRSVTFAVGSDPSVSASTNSTGIATKSYTGATTGGPNKSVELSAVVKDATGKPLAGKVVAFQLGTQSATATTNSSGIATTSLKLAQKNGTYTVSATYDPAANGTDGSFYLGSSQAVTFELQAK